MKFSDLITKKVHIIGINGIGMSALAIYLKKNNIDVSGSDIAKNSNTKILNQHNIKVTVTSLNSAKFATLQIHIAKL